MKSAPTDLLDHCRRSTSGEPQVGWRTLELVAEVLTLDVLYVGRDARVARRLVRLVDGSKLALYSLSRVDGEGYSYDVAKTLEELDLPEGAAFLLV